MTQATAGTPGSGLAGQPAAGRPPGRGSAPRPGALLGEPLAGPAGVPAGPGGTVPGRAAGGSSAARPPLIRALNEKLLLEHIRVLGPCSRAELARASGLSKPTVSLALTNVERSGLVQAAGQRTGVPGRSAVLYEIRPDAGLVLGLDIGHEYLRGAIADLAGEIRARSTLRARASSVRGRVAELVRLGEVLCDEAAVTRSAITQTVIGSPGFYDPGRNAMALTGGLAGWDRPAALASLRAAFGDSVVMENDVDAEALAERALGHGRNVDDFAFVHVGTGIGMGLVLSGQLRRGVHGAAGEIAFMPLSEGAGSDESDARKRGALEATVAAAAVVRAGRKAGIRGPLTARRVFDAAARGDGRAATVVAEETRLVAKAISAIVTVVDPELIVLGGGIGQAPGFADAVGGELQALVPVRPVVRVSALGSDAVVDGCLAAGGDLAWNRLMAALPTGAPV